MLTPRRSLAGALTAASLVAGLLYIAPVVQAAPPDGKTLDG